MHSHIPIQFAKPKKDPIQHHFSNSQPYFYNILSQTFCYLYDNEYKPHLSASHLSMAASTSLYSFIIYYHQYLNLNHSSDRCRSFSLINVKKYDFNKQELYHWWYYCVFNSNIKLSFYDVIRFQRLLKPIRQHPTPNPPSLPHPHAPHRPSKPSHLKPILRHLRPLNKIKQYPNKSTKTNKFLKITTLIKILTNQSTPSIIQNDQDRKKRHRRTAD